MSNARSRRLPVFLATFCLLAAAGAAMVSVPAVAAPGSGCQTVGGVTTYFNGPSGDKVVGRYTSTCSGVCTGEGAVTPFFEVMNFVCPPPPTEP
jgi:hypothetical protein